MTKTNNEFMQSILNEEAWKILSKNFEWSEALLEKYQNEVDWEEISSNSNIRWTIPMVHKFAKRLDWKKFSGCVDEFLNTDTLETFKEQWDWHELSGNSRAKFNVELLEKYADRVDWGELIDRYSYDDKLFEGEGIEFYNKFQEYIPASKLQNSRLWCEMVEEQRSKIINEIIS